MSCDVNWFSLSRQQVLLLISQFCNSAPHSVCKADLSPPNRHAATKQLDRTKLNKHGFFRQATAIAARILIAQSPGPPDSQKAETQLATSRASEHVGAFNLSDLSTLLLLPLWSGAAAIKISGWATPNGGVEKSPRGNQTTIHNNQTKWIYDWLKLHNLQFISSYIRCKILQYNNIINIIQASFVLNLISIRFHPVESSRDIDRRLVAALAAQDLGQPFSSTTSWSERIVAS